MLMQNKNSKAMVLIIFIILLGITSVFGKAMPKDSFVPERHADSFALQAQPVTIDQVVHNKGNIVTTVDNWGYIGGYGHHGLPSGEWPRNTGHFYLAEIKYWMGAVTPSGDTIVANSYDDFQAVPIPNNGELDYKMYLSTDSTRYHHYDKSDTTGFGVGNPAYGWRVWDPQDALWTYNNNYNVLSSNFAPGGPSSLQESHCVFNDVANNQSLGLEITQTVLQWNYCYNEDFMFVILDITNTSANDYTEFALGVYVDIDVGGDDGQGENGRLEDLVAFDVDNNLAWTYDNVGWDPGWGRNVTTGVMGTKYLETPDDIGMTSFRTDDWAIITGIDDPERFNLINSTQFDESLPPTDQFYIQCTRGINLTAGKTVRVVFAIIAGQDEAEFIANSEMAQQLYDNFYVGPQPPVTPNLKAEASEGKVYLQWTDTSEVGIDPLSQINDFAGYKLYRSENQGKTWGNMIYNTNNNCLTSDYETLMKYTVTSPGDPIQHSFIDTGLYNGVEYWYCLSAFDIGDTATGIDPLQSGFGVAGEATNIISVTPRHNPVGFYEATGTVEHIYTGLGQPSPGEVIPTVFDQDALLGADYEVVFEDTPDATYWHLINVTTGDTVLANQTKSGGDPDLFDVSEGMRVVVTNADIVPLGMNQTAFSGSDTTLVVDMGWFLGTAADYYTGQFYGHQHYRSNFELRYTEDSTIGQDLITEAYVAIPFEAWNTTTNERVSLTLYDFDDDGWTSYDLICIVNYPYEPNGDIFGDAWPSNFSWWFGFDLSYSTPSVGDVLTFEGAPLNSPDDLFAFKVDGVDDAAARAGLKDIRVVPNPYFAQYSGLVETSEGESIMEFQKIPENCTIRIYSLTGDLVKTIEHSDGSGIARWNLQSEENRLITSGVYLYHVESDFGEFLGRFAVIK